MTRPSDDVAGRLRRLAALRSAFEVPDFVAVTWAAHGVASFQRYAPEIGQFVDLVYADGWVRASLDWPAWSQRDEAVALFEDPDAMRRATVEQLARVLTVLVRAERFAEGCLAGAVASGLVVRLLRRAEALADAAGEPDAPL